ncbi:uncharacterized protein LOC130625132 [Hydractinia symbiolongicarpus]|uniref:uncharacterized protein LOC130625132 n=1 Tax=Hydractinia symbiolongicarpus TaxID=13093 RepID=UPI00254C7317|nr:uncharacterized protein LOC130625132 [Hydractinia symbiolongicarpus]
MEQSSFMRRVAIESPGRCVHNKKNAAGSEIFVAKLNKKPKQRIQLILIDTAPYLNSLLPPPNSRCILNTLTHGSFGENACDKIYGNDSLRPHLLSCLDAGQMTPFPKIYCDCRMPYNTDDEMVECSKCMEWFHDKCANIANVQALSRRKWFCKKCK